MNHKPIKLGEQNVATMDPQTIKTFEFGGFDHG